MTTGRLAIWNDCLGGAEAAYEAWYQEEHLAERLAIPGFVRGRRYRAVESRPTYFTYYEVTEPGVLTSEVYLSRVNRPTPRTARIMSDVFRNMSRTICTTVAIQGTMRGAYAVTAVTEQALDLPQLVELIPNTPALARIESWQAVPDDTEANAEQALRGPDETIAGCLFAEFLDPADASGFAEALRAEGLGSPGIYRLMCELQA